MAASTSDTCRNSHAPFHFRLSQLYCSLWVYSLPVRRAHLSQVSDPHHAGRTLKNLQKRGLPQPSSTILIAVIQAIWRYRDVGNPWPRFGDKRVGRCPSELRVWWWKRIAAKDKNVTRRSEKCKTNFLHLEHELIYSSCLGCEFATISDWHGARDVGRVVIPFTTCVDEEDLWMEMLWAGWPCTTCMG